MLKPEKLGYCTPEFVERLPRAAESLLRPLRDPSRGAAFCLHLHDAGQNEVARRITGQSREVYELCPLFLPNLKCVTVQNNSLRMVEGRNLQADAVTGVVSARRVALETSTGQATSNDRFWRLRGGSPDDKWAVALHADSEFRLSAVRQAQSDIPYPNRNWKAGRRVFHSPAGAGDRGAGGCLMTRMSCHRGSIGDEHLVRHSLGADGEEVLRCAPGSIVSSIL